MAKRRGNQEGNVTKRSDGRWQASCIVGYDDAGKPKRKYFYGRTQKEVVARMADVQKVVQETGGYTDSKNLTVAAWMETWIKDYKSNEVGPLTLQKRQRDIKNHINPAIGGIKLNRLTAVDIQKFYNGVAGGTSLLQGIHSCLNNALKQAVKLELLHRNPCTGTILRRDHRDPEPKFLDTDQLQQLLQQVRGSDLHTPVYTLAVTGLRLGELLALRWTDIDLADGVVSVRRNLVHTDAAGLLFQEKTKTAAGRRDVYIAADAITVLEKHRASQAEQKLRFGAAYDRAADLVFCREDGSPLNPGPFSKRVVTAMGKAGLPAGFSPHSLRHAYATLSLQAGIDARTTAEQLGHTDPGFTLKLYQGSTRKMKDDAKERIGAIVAACSSDKPKVQNLNR